MKVFVAGATGVLGRRIVRRLLAEGHGVAALSRSVRNREWLSANGAEPRNGDLFDRAGLRDIVAGCDAVVNVATAIPTGARPAAADWLLNDRIRTEGTENLFSAAAAGGCRLFIQEGVTFLYGDRGGEWTDESVPPAAALPPMLRSAVTMEEILTGAAIKGRGPAVTILRFGSLYAHDSAQTAGMFSMVEKRRLPLIGKGDAYWNLIHADDAAEAVLCALAKPGGGAAGTFNICDDEPVKFRDLVHFIAGTLGARSPGRIPALLARLFIGTPAVKFLTASARCSNAAAKRELGWSPSYPTYREGFPIEIQRWRAHAANPPPPPGGG